MKKTTKEDQSKRDMKDIASLYLLAHRATELFRDMDGDLDKYDSKLITNALNAIRRIERKLNK